jgi:F0F1-type ATP synthase assembly protein I
MKMKKIIWMEMALIGASILIFRSVWTFLDSIAWASGRVGLAVLLLVGIVAAVLALRSIEALSEKRERKRKMGEPTKQRNGLTASNRL